MFKLRNIIFYILTFIALSILGMIGSKLLGMADGQGLAGGAIILGHGLVTGVIAFFVSILFSRKLSITSIKKINIIYSIIISIFILVGLFRALIMEKQDEDHPTIPHKASQPVNPTQ